MGEISDWKADFRFADHFSRGTLIREAPEDLPPKDYWEGVRDAWQDSERQPLTPADWKRLFTDPRPGRDEYLMNEEERAELAERVPVYRGVNAFNEIRGISWTLDRERAEWFALRFPDPDGEWPPMVIEATVLRHRIIALFQERQEAEVLAFPRYVYNRSWHHPAAPDPYSVSESPR